MTTTAAPTILAEATTVTNTPAAMLARWTAFLDATPRTVDTYTKGVRQFVGWMAGRGVQQPSRTDVLAFRDDMAAAHKATTVSSYLAAVKLFFRWTAQEGLYPNIADRVKGVKLDREHKRDYLLEGQVRKVLGGIDRTTVGGLRDYAIVALMVTTGLRTVSIMNADIGDIRPAGGCMALYYQGKGHNEKAKYVKLDTAVEDSIRAYLAARGAAASDAPLFASVSPRNRDGRMTTRSISRLVKAGLLGAGLSSDRLTAHSLRHTAATLNIMNGGSVEETQQLLDHANINTTLIYSHALERANNHSESRIARAIFG